MDAQKIESGQIMSDIEYSNTCERNYQRDTYLHFIEYFRKLQTDLANYLANPEKHKQPVIDEQELEENYRKFLANQHDRETIIPLFTSYKEHHYPIWLTNCACWLVCGFGYGYSGLGIELIRAKMRHLLPALARAGDRRALVSKKRSKLPKELLCKQLRWEKISETEWKVTIEPDRELICIYDKIYQKIWG